MRIELAVLTAAVFIGAVSCGGYMRAGDVPAGGCQHDMHCKGDRVCVAGGCQPPGARPAVASAAGASTAQAADMGRACENGNPRACYELGIKAVFGVGGPEDKGQARAYFHQACRMGHVMACTNLGLLIEDKSSRSGDEAARKCLVRDVASYEKACAAGHADACFNAARLYDGQLLYKIPRDPAKARNLFEEACDLGRKEACARVEE